MEEDIKILKELIKYWKDLIKRTDISSPFYKWIKDEKIKQRMCALENLIEKYVDLKDTVFLYNIYEVDNPYKIIIADKRYFANGTFVNKFIEKDKIFKLIRDLENQKSLIDIDFKAFYRIKDLKEVEINILEELIKENENHIPRID